ncbi:hypothetical protein [Thermococcus barophilus]|nr:hypothetical protein [Thermococcus barophilus]
MTKHKKEEGKKLEVIIPPLLYEQMTNLIKLGVFVDENEFINYAIRQALFNLAEKIVVVRGSPEGSFMVGELGPQKEKTSNSNPLPFVPATEIYKDAQKKYPKSQKKLSTAQKMEIVLTLIQELEGKSDFGAPWGELWQEAKNMGSRSWNLITHSIGYSNRGLFTFPD